MTSTESIAEGAALAWLEGLGCAVLHGPDIAPGKLLVRNAKRDHAEAELMAKLEPRKLMKQAIEVMRQSVAEPRTDGNASPLVGVVLWKPDGTVQTACRGELRDGDHAEYTLLERKNRYCKLDDAALFAT